MRRTNTFVIAPDPGDEECLRRLLGASASFWNELTYDRRQRLFAGDLVWEGSDCGDRYRSLLSAATVQTVRRVNDEAWRSFFALADSDEHPSPPSYWGNEEDGRELRTYIRNDEYTIQWGQRSRLEIPVGRDLKQQYGLGYRERLRLEIRGTPKWDGKQGRLPIKYDEISSTFRAFQPVTVPASRQDSPLASYDAALDVGVNNLVACSTTTGVQYLYNGRALFRQFRETTGEIARLQSKLPEGRHSSKRIRQLYRRRTRRRDHAQNALVRNLIERLHAAGVATVYASTGGCGCKARR